MDELAYHRSRQAINALPCVFEKAILAGCAQCGLAQRHALAEREVVACSREVARINCTTLHSLFRERALFALHLPRASEPVSHARMMQLQCGGLRGLQLAVLAAPNDVHAKVQQAMANDASLLDLPWDKIVASMVAWKIRRRAPTAPT